MWPTTRPAEPPPWKPVQSTPIPERGEPLSLKATPARSPTSSKVPLPLLIKRKLGIVSLATNRSVQPSLFTSVATTPNDLPGDFAIPDFSLTSVTCHCRCCDRDGLAAV